jgi:hypothetical protein
MYTRPQPPKSTIERAHEESQRISSGLAPLFARQLEGEQRRVSVAESCLLDAAAQELSDHMFDDDPEIAALRAELEVCARRSKLVATAAARSKQPAVLAEIQALIERSAEALRLAAIDDVIDGDSTFARASAASRHLDAMRERLAHAQLGFKALNREPFQVEVEFRDRARDAENRLKIALLERKREYVAKRRLATEAPPAAAPTRHRRAASGAAA